MSDFPSKKVTLGLIQSKVSDDPDKNLAHTVEMVRGAAKQGAQIVCLQELYRSPYFPIMPKHDVSEYLETIPGPSTEAFSQLAKELGVVIIVPIFEKAKEGIFNSAVVIDETGKLLDTYRKLHIPHDPGFYEKDYFEEGNSGYKIYKTKYATFAVLICFDQWFPEAARMARLEGAEIIFYPTAIGDWIGYVPPYNQNWHEAWETVQRGHSIANGMVIATVNRVGIEDKTKFWGQSFITDSFGTIEARAGTDEEILIGTVDLAMNEFIFENWRILQRRRPDTYKKILDDTLVDKTTDLPDSMYLKSEKERFEK